MKPHQEETMEWEKVGKYIYLDAWSFYGDKGWNKMKSFIRQTLTLQHTKDMEEFGKVIELTFGKTHKKRKELKDALEKMKVENI